MPRFLLSVIFLLLVATLAPTKTQAKSLAEFYNYKDVSREDQFSATSADGATPISSKTPLVLSDAETFSQSIPKQQLRTSAVYDQTESTNLKHQRNKMKFFQESLHSYLAEVTQHQSKTFTDEISTKEQSQNEKRQPRLRLPTLPIEEENEPYYDTIEIGYAWMTGYKVDQFWDNTTECFDRMTNYTYNELPEFRDQLAVVDLSQSDKLEKTLYLVSNLSEHLWYCNSAWQQSNRFYYDHFNTFNSFGHFVLSMLQNFLGQSISLTNILNSLQEYIDTDNTFGVHYESARIARILTIFPPVELVDGEYTTSGSVGGDPDNIPDPDNNLAIPDRLHRTPSGHMDNADYGPLVRAVDTLFGAKSQDLAWTAAGISVGQEYVRTKERPQVGGAFGSALDGKEKGSLSDFKSPLAMTELTLGFLNATQITFGGSRTDCQRAGEELYYQADEGWKLMTEDWFSWFDFWESIDYYLIVPHNLYLLQFACTESVYEVDDLLSKYGTFMTDASTIWFNLFYSSGNIIKGIVNVAMYFMAKEYTRVSGPYSMGMELGQIFWLVFFPVEEYLDVALDEGQIWGQDYTWDEVIHLADYDEEAEDLPGTIF